MNKAVKSLTTNSKRSILEARTNQCQNHITPSVYASAPFKKPKVQKKIAEIPKNQGCAVMTVINYITKEIRHHFVL